MAVKIKLKRMGKIREPYYRIVVADARTKRDGRAIEEIGKYHPKAEPSLIEVNSDRVQHWLSVGAQPTDPVCALLKITGDWQRYKGLPGAEGTLRVAAPRVNKKDVFAAALAETLADGGSTTPKGRARAGTRSGDAKASEAKAGEAKAALPAKADTAKTDTAKTDTAKADAAKADAAKADAAKTAKADAAKADAAKADAAKAETVNADSEGAEPTTADVASPGGGAATGATQVTAGADEAPAGDAGTGAGEPGASGAGAGDAPATLGLALASLRQVALGLVRRRPGKLGLALASLRSSRAAELEVLEEALEHLVRGIVDFPDDVRVSSRNLRRGRVLQVRVHPDDLGKVIGRGGRARALRTVMGSLAGDSYVRVDLLDADEIR